MKKGDIFVYIGVAFIMVASILGAYLLKNAGGERHLIIEVDRKRLYDIPLKENMERREIRIEEGEGKYNVVVIEDGLVRVSEANCSDQICVQWGAVRNPGQTIVCLPHKMTIKIIGRENEPSEIDELAS